jgi:hypothetical protein
MVSEAVAHLPTAVSLLLLQALFMQISGVSLTLTWPCRLCSLSVLLCTSHCYKLSPFQAHWGRWHCTRFLRPACLFTVHVGSGSSPSPVEFSSLRCFYKLSRSWLLSSAAAPALSSRLIVRDFPTSPFSVQGAPPSLLCVFFVIIAYYSVFFFFFPWMGVGLSGAMLIWPRVVCGSTMYCLAHLVVCVFPSRLGTGI